MTFGQLRTFLAVVEHGSVRAAAEHLVVSQPAVSGAVASLERELGLRLVARQGRGLRITAAGRRFALSVREGLGVLDRAVRDATSVSDPEVGTVRLAAVTTAAERLLLPLLAAFRQTHPGARIDLDVGNRSTVWAALRAHEVDLVVAGRPPVAAPARVLGLAPNRLVVVGPDGPPSSRSDGAAVAALADQTWLLREDGSGTREATDELLAGLGITPPTMLLGSNGAVARAAATGLGVTLVSTSAVSDELADGSLVAWPCPGTPLERPWHLVSHRDVELSPTAILLLRVLRESGGFALEPEAARLLRS